LQQLYQTKVYFDNFWQAYTRYFSKFSVTGLCHILHKVESREPA